MKIPMNKRSDFGPPWINVRIMPTIAVNAHRALTVSMALYWSRFLLRMRSDVPPMPTSAAATNRAVKGSGTNPKCVMIARGAMKSGIANAISAKK